MVSQPTCGVVPRVSVSAINDVLPTCCQAPLSYASKLHMYMCLQRYVSEICLVPAPLLSTACAVLRGFPMNLRLRSEPSQPMGPTVWTSTYYRC